MKFSMKKVPANTTEAHKSNVWVVEKTLAGGECYLIATFSDPSLARWCFDSFRVSLEAKAGANMEAEAFDYSITEPLEDY